MKVSVVAIYVNLKEDGSWLNAKDWWTLSRALNAVLVAHNATEIIPVKNAEYLAGFVAELEEHDIESLQISMNATTNAFGILSAEVYRKI